jgi:hypothetical protein
MKKYELISDDGCFCDSCQAKNAKEARGIFSQNWTGNFVIICRSQDEKSVNVRLK